MVVKTWDEMELAQSFKIRVIFLTSGELALAVFITLEVSHFLVWQDVLWIGGLTDVEKSLSQLFIWFSPLLPVCAFSANLGIMGLLYAFHSRLWMSAQRPVAKKNKMAVKMQTLEVKKKGAPNNLPLNLKGTKWGTSGQFILLFTDNKSLCFYVLSLVFHNLFERRWEIM